MRGTQSAFFVIALLFASLTSPAHAAQVQDLVRIKGAEQNKIIGIGLVVGLAGTGDSGKYLPAMRALAALTQQLGDPNVNAIELKNVKNVALVQLTATVAPNGGREGDLLDVKVASIGEAKSLAGGHLVITAMTLGLPNSPVFAFASGDMTVEDNARPTVAMIRSGAQLVRDVPSQCVTEKGRMTLVLNDSVASWPASNNLANLINGIIAPDGPSVAKAVDPKNITIDLPSYERSDPAPFISQIMQAYIDPAMIGSGARVVINEKTGTIIVTGDVQISPVLISHKGLTITTVTPQVEPSSTNPKVESSGFLTFDPEKRGGTKLADLLAAFNQLKIEAADRIAIIKEIDRSGKLHAKLVIE